MHLAEESAAEATADFKEHSADPSFAEAEALVATDPWASQAFAVEAASAIIASASGFVVASSS